MKQWLAVALVVLGVVSGCSEGVIVEELPPFSTSDLPLFVLQPDDVSIPLSDSNSSAESGYIIDFYPQVLVAEKFDPYKPLAGESRRYQQEEPLINMTSHAILFKDSQNASKAFQVFVEKETGGRYGEGMRINADGLGDESVGYAAEWDVIHANYGYIWRVRNVVILLTFADYTEKETGIKRQDARALADKVWSHTPKN